MRGRTRWVLATVLAALAPAVAVVAVPTVAGVAQLATSTPPPTPVLLPNGRTTLSPFPSVLRTPEPSRRPPEISAPSAILADLDSGQVLFEKAADEARPIASLTKIMTALLAMERAQPQDLVTVSARAAGDGPTPGISELGLIEGEPITVGSLLYALLLQSANDAALALAEHVSGSVESFVAAMNARARRLGARHTRFSSPSGLDDAGVSTARDLVRITSAAYRLPGFGSIVATQTRAISSPEGLPPRVVQNRNALLWLYPGAIGVKTGYTSRAGYCVVAAAERGGLRLIAVVLGAPRDAFSDAATLLDYGSSAFERREVIAAGEPLGTIDISGHEIPVASGASLVALVRRGAEVSRRIDVADVAFPPRTGEAIGTVTLSVPELRIGRVPLVVASVPAPPAPRAPGPWWARAATSVLRAASSVLRALFA